MITVAFWLLFIAFVFAQLTIRKLRKLVRRYQEEADFWQAEAHRWEQAADVLAGERDAQ